MVENLPASTEDVNWEDLQNKMAIHCSILAWERSQTEEPGGLQSMGWQESDST